MRRYSEVREILHPKDTGASVGVAALLLVVAVPLFGIAGVGIMMMLSPAFWIVLALASFTATVLRKTRAFAADKDLVLLWAVPFVLPFVTLVFSGWQHGATSHRASYLPWQEVAVMGSAFVGLLFAILLVGHTQTARSAVLALAAILLNAGSWLVALMGLSNTYL